MATVRFLLNGQTRRLTDVPATRTLLQHLRLNERMTGSKEGCAEGDCGACTVMVGAPDASGGFDWRAVNGCILLLGQIDGRAVVTVEGLAEQGALHPVQSAMVAMHASQCGYCTPGFVMSMAAHDAAGLPGDDDAIHETLSGNLCRCTGYRPIVDAMRAVCGQTQSGFSGERTAQWRCDLDALRSGAPAVSGEQSAQGPCDPAPAFAAPDTLDALDAAVSRSPGARLLAGGTDIGVWIAKDGFDPGPLVAVNRIPDLRRIRRDETGVSFGAAVTYAEALPVLDSEAPAFAAMVRRIGSRQIRNAGTIGGNLCNASPIGDSAPALIALDATAELRCNGRYRTVALDAFFQGYRKTVLAPGEYLTSIRFPRLSTEHVFRVYKLSKRHDQDISTVSMAARLTVQNGHIAGARIAFGGMAATPKRALMLESALVGAPVAMDSFLSAAPTIAGDFTPLTDFRGSADYRLTAASGLVRRLGMSICAGGETGAPPPPSTAPSVPLAPPVPLEVWSL